MHDTLDGETDDEQTLRNELSRVLTDLATDGVGDDAFVLADPDDDVVHVVDFGTDRRPRHVGTADEASRRASGPVDVGWPSGEVNLAGTGATEQEGS